MGELAYDKGFDDGYKARGFNPPEEDDLRAYRNYDLGYCQGKEDRDRELYGE